MKNNVTWSILFILSNSGIWFWTFCLLSQRSRRTAFSFY